jgi:hypothetical protein
MPERIYLIGKDQDLLELNEQAFDTEDVLQELLAKYPKLLAGEQLDMREPRRWLFVSRELSVPDGSDVRRWSLDHLFIDQEAVPTLVEVKRSTDSRIRREVVGQMLDYAANSVIYWPIEHLVTSFEKVCESQAQDPAQVLDEFLGGQDPDAFWSQVKTNLRAGKVRLVFVADKIPTELQRIVEFLNEQMDPAEVVAVEVKRFLGQGMETLVPRLVGRTAEAVGRKSISRSMRRDWDEQSFFAELLEKRGMDEHNVAKYIYEWSLHNMTRTTWGHGLKDGSCIPVFDYNGENYWPFALWTYGRVEVQFQYLKDRPPFDSIEKRMELLKRLNEVPGVNLPEDGIDRRPSIRLSALTHNDASNHLLNVFAWIIEVIKNG